MATVTWHCPVPHCPTRRNRPTTCTVHLVPLVRDEPVPAPGSGSPSAPAAAQAPTAAQAPAGQAPAAAPAPGPASGQGVPSWALDCPWGQLVEIPPEGLEIGREAPAFQGGGIAVYDQVSRQHAALTWREDHLLVTELGSSNGTFVDGEPVPADAPVALRVGQTLRLGLDVPCQVVALNEFGEPR